MINLAPLNNHIYNQPFKVESLENLRYLVNPGDYFVKIDLSDAYLSIPVHDNSQPYLAFVFRPGHSAVWRASFPSGNWNSNGDQLCSIAC